MTTYSNLTELALSHATSPLQAWENAKQTLAERDIGTPISRAKGCPKAAFVGLAKHGYVRGFVKPSDRPLRENARHALCAYRLYLADPALLGRKPAWWQAVAAERGISRKGQNGVLDVMAALIQHDAFLATSETTPN
ncbi:hypothetical protein DESA109040_19055 [Deinococcus saxicola]|uniref:DUF6979 family protein n=1 Tax=Deinococcus saxicola TaxID=249406 RepID=UPI0039EF50D9